MSDDQGLRCGIPVPHEVYERTKDNNESEMKRRYQVRWYEYNLTVPRCRKFFTELGATLFHVWLFYFRKEESIIYEETK
jgi:hypothetical protein